MSTQVPGLTTPLTGQASREYLEKTLGAPLPVLNRFPKYFLIETINSCNARCIMCGIDFDKKERARMTPALFDKLCDEIAGYKDHVEKVMLYLDCEPLLDKDLAKRIRKMKDAGVKRVNIATNASILSEKRSREIIEAGLNEIYITIDSLKKEVYEKIRVRLTFEDVYNNTRMFIKLRNELNPKLGIRLQMVLQELNQDEGPGFEQHWKEYLRPNDQIAVQRAHNWAGAAKVMAFGDENQVNNIPCIALWGTLCIHVDGTVGLCCMDTTSSVKLGNVQEQTIEQVWTGHHLKQIRDKHLDGRRAEIEICDGCTLWRESKRDLKRIVGAD